MTTKIALAGIGKIARDQHVPALSADPDWDLAATISRSGSVDGVEAFTGIEEMLAARPDIPVISLALPPQPRFDYAAAALRAGRHVMLEKPPGATLTECVRTDDAGRAGMCAPCARRRQSADHTGSGTREAAKNTWS